MNIIMPFRELKEKMGQSEVSHREKGQRLVPGWIL
jgi:hypothetical protein